MKSTRSVLLVAALLAAPTLAQPALTPQGNCTIDATTAILGGSSTLNLQGPAGAPFSVAFDSAPGVLPVPGLGTIWLGYTPALTFLVDGLAGLAPPLKIHVVARGDWLSKIAKKYGLSSWRALYYHAANEAFRAKRPNPDRIYPGDKLVIPDDAPREVTVETGPVHTFRIIGPDAPPDTGDVVDAVARIEAEQEEPGESPDDYTLLYDTESGLLYRVPNEMLAEMRVSAEKLARIRDDIKAAHERPADQRANAVAIKVQELHDYCELEPRPYEPFKAKEVMEGRGWRRHEHFEIGEAPIREFVVFEKRELIYLPRNGQRLLESKFRGRMTTTSIKDAVESHADDEADEAAKGRAKPY